MIADIAIAALIAASFGIGAFLYKSAEEEVDAVKRKFKSEFLTKAKNIALASVGMLGILQAVATTSNYFEAISITMLAFAIWFGSFVVAEKDNKLTLKYTAETIVTFLVFFVLVYVIVNLPALL